VITFDVIIIKKEPLAPPPGVAWSVGLSATVVSPTKTAEPIEMPFWLSAWLGPRNHVLYGKSTYPMGRGNFRDLPASAVQKWLNRSIKMPFGILSRVDPGNHVFDGVQILQLEGVFRVRGVYGSLQSIEFWGFCKRVSCMKIG